MKMKSSSALFCTLLFLGFFAQTVAVADEPPDDEDEDDAQPTPVQPAPARPSPRRPSPTPAPDSSSTPAPETLSRPPLATRSTPSPVTMAEPFLKGYIDGYYVPWAELDGNTADTRFDAEGDGFGLKGMALMGSGVRFVLAGEYEVLNFDESEPTVSNLDVDKTHYRIGPGIGINPDRNSFVYGLAQYVGTDTDTDYTVDNLKICGEPLCTGIETYRGPFDDHEDGFGVFGGFRVATPHCLGIEGQAGWLDLEDYEGFEFTLGGFFQFVQFAASSLGVFADFRTAQLHGDTLMTIEPGLDEARVGLRLNFQSPGTRLSCV